MIKVTEQIVDAAEVAAFRAGGNGKTPSRDVLRSIVHSVPSVRFTEIRKIALNTAIAALQDLALQRDECCDSIVEELESLKKDLERFE